MDNTIFDFSKASKSALLATTKTLGVKYSDKDYLTHWVPANMIVWGLYEENKMDSATLRHERFRLFFESIGGVADQHKASDIYVGHLSQGSQLIENAEEVLEKLFKSYKMVAITNGFAEIQHSRLDNTGLRKFFEAIIISDEVGVSKPHPDIFRIALEAGGVSDKSRVLMIGDNPVADIKGAADYGLDTCFFRYAKSNRAAEINPTYTITRLRELIGILGVGG